MVLFVKIALLTITIRVFALYPYRVYFIKGFIFLLCCYYIAALITKFNLCRPISVYWEGLSQGGSCLSQQGALVADSVISVSTDMLILLLPLPLIWSLRISRAKKLRVIFLLGAGGSAVAFTLYRLVLVLRRANSPDQSRFFVRLILTG